MKPGSGSGAAVIFSSSLITPLSKAVVADQSRHSLNRSIIDRFLALHMLYFTDSLKLQKVIRLLFKDLC